MLLTTSELIYLPCYCVLLSFCGSVFKPHFGELSSPDDAKVTAPNRSPTAFEDTPLGVGADVSLSAMFLGDPQREIEYEKLLT